MNDHIISAKRVQLDKSGGVTFAKTLGRLGEHNGVAASVTILMWNIMGTSDKEMATI